MTLIPKIVIAHRWDSRHSWHSRRVFLAFQPHGLFFFIHADSYILRNFSSRPFEILAPSACCKRMHSEGVTVCNPRLPEIPRWNLFLFIFSFFLQLFACKVPTVRTLYSLLARLFHHTNLMWFHLRSFNNYYSVLIDTVYSSMSKENRIENRRISQIGLLSAHH
jgi:hypothetical protein